MQISLVLGFLLIATAGGSYFYINMQKAQISQLQVELQTAVNNQEVLESTIANQNTQMQEQLESQRQNQARIADLSSANNSAREEVRQLRNTFARHDMGSLAIARPESIQRIINAGTARVHQQFIDLTNPNQFERQIDEAPDPE
jgi:preprotein translocase subunit SecD